MVNLSLISHCCYPNIPTTQYLWIKSLCLRLKNLLEDSKRPQKQHWAWILVNASQMFMSNNDFLCYWSASLVPVFISKSLQFLSGRIVFAMYGGLIAGFMLRRWLRIGAGQDRKTNQVIRGWDFKPSDTSQTYREGEMETEFNHIANESSSHTYIIKPNKNYGTEARVSFLIVGIHQCTRRMVCPESTEASLGTLRTFSVCLFIWLLWFESFIVKL